MTLWTIAHQSPLSMRFPGKNTAMPPPPGHLPHPGIERMSPMSTALQADSLLSEPPEN